MPKRILIIDGHPDPDPARFCHALAAAYAEGAAESKQQVRLITLASLDFPLLRSAAEWDVAPVDTIAEAQRSIAWAEHIVIVFPLWLGNMPALLKAFFEQVLRPGFGFDPKGPPLRNGLLTGRSARVVVTMGMPAALYRWFFFALGLRSLDRNILKFCGIGPIANTVIGSGGGAEIADRQKWLGKIKALGRYAR